MSAVWGGGGRPGPKVTRPGVLLVLALALLGGCCARVPSRELKKSDDRKKAREKERHEAAVKKEANEEEALIQEARVRVVNGTTGNATAANTMTTTPQWDGFYDFIFGWSTGHVGTTTLSEKRLYGSPDNVTFLHEMKYGRFGNPPAVFTTDNWLVGNFTDEYLYVKYKYIPWLLHSKYARSRTVMDLGHNINYFSDALIMYLLKETNYTFAFVRLRRQRHEAAQSLTFAHPDQAFSDVCMDLITRFCPFDRVTSNILRVPGPNAYALWGNFTNLQKAFWIGDETEQRWQAMKRRYAGQFKMIEVLWGKQFLGSIEFAAAQVAQLLGIQRITPWDASWPHMEQHVHAGDSTIDPVALLQAYREDLDYQEKMGYAYIPA